MRALAALALALLLGGCSSDNDDRAFFEEGWVKPEQGANRRLYRSHAPMNPNEERKVEDR